MKSYLIFLFVFMSVAAFGQQVIHGLKEMSPEKRIMIDCDQRVFYEIFIRSFYDSDGDGIGDLNGITMKLDYLQQLGIGGIWITPFNPAPSYHKYDVTDYYAVDKIYGTVEDFKHLVEEAHRRNILVLMDLVVNHTSWKHPWFQAALHNDPQYRDYYCWSADPPETKDGGWYLPKDEDGKEIGGDKYYGFFWRGMPDLNFDNPALRKEIINVGLWWLRETKLDGFRLDAAQHIYDANHPATNVTWWKEFTDSLKKLDPTVITIGECWNNYPLVAQYTAALSGAFNFELSWVLLKSLQEEKNDSIAELLVKIRNEYDKYSDHFIDPVFLSNHDNNRILSDLDNNLHKAKLAACIYLTLPGTPFIYYGEEIGMRGIKPDSLIREPFLWDAEGKEEHQTHWERGINSNGETVQPLSEQLHEKSSIYQHYKNLISLRKENEALTSHDLTPVDFSDLRILSYIRGSGSEQLWVIHNLSSEDISVTIPDEFNDIREVVYSSPEKIKRDKEKISLPPFSTVILQQ